ncbi:MAG: aminomethyl-transferring glycine dehydrogenase subunit GcvPA [Deltaproteobacteria bacterium]|nr:aminomethyl-transferring glycine dehydrogenase subunit GcvPA [Deltaproteobacteria bacterium]MBW2150447.1 aminomethyl-transferring glycine dehydrogenase subunit GcvPA [Deltaproteobacteria bacterium]
MRYFPHTDVDIHQMLKAIGADSLDALFSHIPKECRRFDPLDLPAPLTEWELTELLGRLSAEVAVSPEYRLFTGAGSYDHFIPSSVSYLISRSEFVTSYTPYQPEMSQGTLQAIFEFQTLVSRLLGMEVANASLYDGASSLAEALLMSIRITGNKKVAVSSLVHPLYRRVVNTYFSATDYEIIELPYLEDGTTDLTSLQKVQELAAVAVQSPNFFGSIEDLPEIGKEAKEKNALLVTCFTEPIAYGLLKSPGSQGADIVCGEGQSLGIPRSFGGPGLGLFASRLKYVRHMPGRLVGETVDKDGRRAYVLTLATREQHIRREKATSNICTNNSLCALAAAMYMASAGKSGMNTFAKLNFDKSEYLKNGLRKAGCKLPFKSRTFNEFVVIFPQGAYQRLLKKKIIAGIPLDRFYPDLSNHYVLCVTETATKEAMDILIQEVTA